MDALFNGGDNQSSKAKAGGRHYFRAYDFCGSFRNHVRDPLIIPPQQRVTMFETQPAAHDAQIRLEELVLDHAGTLTTRRLVCQIHARSGSMLDSR